MLKNLSIYMKKFIYKICFKSDLLQLNKKGFFKGNKKDKTDGYVHFSNKNQIKSTLKKYFYNQDKLVLIKVKTEKLKNLIWEESAIGELFPHLYSYFNSQDIKKIYKISLSKEKKHILPKVF